MEENNPERQLERIVTASEYSWDNSLELATKYTIEQLTDLPAKHNNRFEPIRQQ